MIKILSMVLIYKLAGAVIQPLGDEDMVKCLNDLAGNLTFIAITVGSVAVMFLLPSL